MSGRNTRGKHRKLDTQSNSRHSILFVFNPQKALEELEELKKIVPGEALVYFLLSKVCLCSVTVNDIQNPLKTKTESSFHGSV